MADVIFQYKKFTNRIKSNFVLSFIVIFPIVSLMNYGWSFFISEDKFSWISSLSSALFITIIVYTYHQQQIKTKIQEEDDESHHEFNMQSILNSFILTYFMLSSVLILIMVAAYVVYDLSLMFIISMPIAALIPAWIIYSRNKKTEL